MYISHKLPILILWGLVQGFKKTEKPFLYFVQKNVEPIIDLLVGYNLFLWQLKWHSVSRNFPFPLPLGQKKFVSS